MGAAAAASKHDRPLIPSEKHNAAAAASRRTRTRTISSRYLSSTPPTLPAPAAAAAADRRSYSVGRARPDPPATITRSISVSFQGASFFYQTTKATPCPEPRRATTPLRSTTPLRTTKPAVPSHHSNISRLFERWPAARPPQSSPDCCSDGALLRQGSLDGGDLSASSDTDTVSSSGSNSGAPELSVPISARFVASKITAAPESPGSSPRSVCSSFRRTTQTSSPRTTQTSSPSKLADASPRSRGMASPLRARSIATPADQPGNAPSIISFAVEVRRARKGENRIEEAHMLRLLHNRQLQWRFVNARATAAMRNQRMVVEKNLNTAWTKTSGLRDSVINKRIKQQLLTHDLKLTTILKGQMSYLEEWSLIEKDHSSSLLGSNEALKASILRLPVVDGARADLLEVKDTISSTVDVMKAMGSSICSLLSKVEVTSLLVSELAKVAAQEQSLLDQARELLCRVAEMHVLQCSLQGHIVQLNRSHSQMHL